MKQQLVKVTWFAADKVHGWRTAKEAGVLAGRLVETLGYLVPDLDGAGYLRVAQSYDEDSDRYNEVVVIPRSALADGPAPLVRA